MNTSQDMPSRAVAPAAKEAKLRPWLPLVLIYAVLALGISAGGWFSCRNYERRFRTEVERKLSALADLKAMQITHWYQDRVIDAYRLQYFPHDAVRRDLAFLAHPVLPPTEEIYTSWLIPLLDRKMYERTLLLDEQLNVEVVRPESASRTLCEESLRAAQKALRSQQVVVNDLHWEKENSYLSLMVPLSIPWGSTTNTPAAAGTGSVPANRSAGLLVLEINSDNLYYLIPKWQTTNRTVETVLVRRDGNDALVLNELRFKTHNTGLKLRIPLGNTNDPAVRAALGQRGMVVEGKDYRGVPVVAALRGLSGTPWHMALCMDTTEAYAPLREYRWLMVLFTVSLLLAAGAGLGWLWRQQRVQFYREKAATAEALRASQQIIEGILNAMPVRVFWKDKNLRYLGCNAAFARDTGYADPKDLIGKDDYQTGWREQAELYRADDRQVIESGRPKLLIEEPQTTPDGNTITLLTSKIPLRGPNGEVSGMLGTYMDITERKRAELEIQRLAAFPRFNPNPVLELSAVGEINYSNDAAGEMARALGLENPAQIMPPDTAALVRECLATGQPNLRVETRNGPRVISWSFFPVQFNQTVHCYGGDITERKRAEEKIQQLSRAVEQSPASIVITDPAGNIEYINPKFVEVTGYSMAEVLGRNPRVLKSGEKSPEAYRELWQTITAGKEWRGEFHNKKKNGELYWESASISPIRDPAGRVTHYVAVKEDITGRKQTEAERDRLIRELQAALASVKSLSGLLPICAGCKKIRDDTGYWSQVESYIQVHSEATFTHGLCPDCITKYYPDLEEPGRPS